MFKLILVVFLLEDVPKVKPEQKLEILNQFVIDLNQNKQSCAVQIAGGKALSTGGATALVAWLTNKNPKLQVLASLGTAAGVSSVLSEIFENKRSDCIRNRVMELSKKRTNEYYQELIEGSLKQLTK